MKDYMRTEGIWVVKKYDTKTRVKKISDIPKKWPLFNHIEYREELIDELTEYVKTPKSLNDVIVFIVEFISKKYLEDYKKRNSSFSDKIVKKINKLYK